MLEYLNSLTMEAVIVLLGSIVTITLGIFGYLLKVRPLSNGTTEAEQKALTTLVRNHAEQIDKLHARVTDAKETALENKVEVRAIINLIKAVEKQLAGHEHRDLEDFKVMQQKIDKVMDIVIQILQDDKL